MEKRVDELLRATFNYSYDRDRKISSFQPLDSIIFSCKLCNYFAQTTNNSYYLHFNSMIVSYAYK